MTLGLTLGMESPGSSKLYPRIWPQGTVALGAETGSYCPVGPSEILSDHAGHKETVPEGSRCHIHGHGVSSQLL